MLESNARPAFVIACTCNAAFSILSMPTLEPVLVGAHPLMLMGGALAFVVAAVLGAIVLFGDGRVHHAWTKAALVFLALGPLAFWFLQWPAVITFVCFDCTIAPEIQARAIGDIFQSQFAMIAVALGALFCATRALTAPLEELAI